jgi:hypothetical protein
MDTQSTELRQSNLSSTASAALGRSMALSGWLEKSNAQHTQWHRV